MSDPLVLATREAAWGMVRTYGPSAIFSSINGWIPLFTLRVCAECVSFLTSREEISMARKVGCPIHIRASVDSLKQDRVPVVVKKLFVSFRKRTHVQNFVRR